MLLGLVSLLALLLSALLWTRLLRPVGWVDALLYVPLMFMAHVLVAGYVLSALVVLDKLEAWALASLCILALTATVRMYSNRRSREAVAVPVTLQQMRDSIACRWSLMKQQYANVSAGEKRLIAPLVVTATVLALVNFDLALNTTPHNWDSMTYHLARMAYYLQHGHMGAFDANYWAQVTHPKNATLMLLYTYLVSGRNENMTSLVQFAAYLTAALAVYGISRRLGRDRFSSAFAALVFALLIECLMQSITTQNDMQLTALMGIAVYALLAYRERKLRRYLLVCAVSAGIAVGVKSSALLVGLSLAVVALFVLWSANSKRGWRTLARDTALLSAAVTASFIAFALPAGYLENWRLFGNPIGTEYVRKLHAFEDQPLSYVALNGTRNLLRFGFEFLSFDGLPAGGVFADMQRDLRWLPRQIVESLGLNLETKEATRDKFVYDKPPSIHEDASSWGVFGFTLILPLVILALFGLVRSPGSRALAVAFGVFMLAQAFSGPYDPWRGRYFIVAAVFAVPVIACCVRNTNPIWRVYLTLIVMLGCLAAFTGVVGRWNNMPEEVFTMNRLQQLTRNRRNYYPVIRRFKEIVPANAVVAAYFGEDTFEYPLFGEKLTRTLLPINSFWQGPLPIPAEADYFIYSSNLYTDRRLVDIWLGEDWYLRDLK